MNSLLLQQALSRVETLQETDCPDFLNLARHTALKRYTDGTFSIGNWRRGPLLAELVCLFRPANVLEIGTGRGYGAASIVMGSRRSGVPVTVWTVDKLSPDVSQRWAIDDGSGPRVDSLSVSDAWRRYVDPALSAHVRFVTGRSVRALHGWRRKGRPLIDFSFIDGGHDYWTAKHDFLAALRISSDGAVFLLDDYTDRQGYGVKAFIDQEVRPLLPEDSVVSFQSGSRDHTKFGEDVGHGMVLVSVEQRGRAALLRRFSNAAYWTHTVQYLVRGAIPGALRQ